MSDLQLKQPQNIGVLQENFYSSFKQAVPLQSRRADLTSDLNKENSVWYIEKVSNQYDNQD